MPAAQHRTKRLAGALAFLVLLAGGAASADAAVVTLHAAPAAAGAANCSSQANVCTIANAVTTANSTPTSNSVEIKLAGGSYALGGMLTISFAGPSLTISPESGTPTLDGGGVHRPLRVGAGTNVTLDGLVIEDGKAPLGNAAGAIVNEGTLTIRRSRVTTSQGNSGGAIQNSSGATLMIEDSTFAQNSAIAGSGGAIISYGVAATILRSAFIGNTSSSDGGAIDVQGGTMTIAGSTFAGNSSTGVGGAIMTFKAMTVVASTFAGNSTSSPSQGSAIFTGAEQTTLAASIIAPQGAGSACKPTLSTVIDAGYNLDTDGSCVSASSPATGSHAGTASYGLSTYGAALGAYLADATADHGGPTPTIALLNTPNPATMLANPAFDAIPATFALPVAIGGITTACGLPDQRGVAAAPGANCAIGAYRLQATSTAVTASPDPAEQNAPVTLTATVAPNATGGTVSFDDGAGNPATAACAAQPVVAGKATCTISYPNTGEVGVTAAYSGDGAGNNFAASVSSPARVTIAAPVMPTTTTETTTPPTTPTDTTPKPAPDRIPPVSAIKRPGRKLTQPIALRGSASDNATISRVRISVERRAGKKCRFLAANRRFSAPRSCSKPVYLNVKGTKAWSYRLPKLAPGSYTIRSRALDAAGNAETKSTRSNLLRLTIRAV